MPSLRPIAFVLTFAPWLGACGAGDEPPTVQDDPGNAELLIELVAPESGAVVPQNRKVTIVFRNPVLADSLQVEVDGELVRLATLDDREFRFVPFPLHDPATSHEVRIRAGLEDVAGQVLDRDFAWVFETEPAAWEQTPPLTADEVAWIESGQGGTPMDLVTDYDDPLSTLYDISPPIDPTCPQLSLLVDRLLTSVVYHGGIGLAAPQVGVNRRLFVAQVDGEFRAFVNPTALAWSETWSDMVEGCLSVPDQEVSVARPTWIEFSYDRPDGTPVQLERLENSGLFAIPARVWLHEFDHLNGILLVDRAGTPTSL